MGTALAATVTVVMMLSVSAQPVAAAEQQEEERERERFSWSGDARFRPEPTLNVPDAPDRFRVRVRLRFAGSYRLTDQFTVGGRLTTGNPDDPNSPYQDLGSIFDRFPFTLDRLNIAWTPHADLRVTAGKFAHPFTSNAVYAELVWDADVQPEGVMARYARRGGDGRWSFALAAGEYILHHQSRVEDSTATVAQASAEIGLGAEAVLSAAVGLYDYLDLAAVGTRALLRDNAGNATVDVDGDGQADRFASDFRLVDTIIHLRLDGLSRPTIVGGQYVRNLEANVPDRQGWALGGAYGTLQDIGDWRAYYQYQRIAQDAVLSAFAQDDFPFQTNFRGHVVGLNYQARDGVDLHGWALISRPVAPAPGSEPTHQWRLRFDLTVGF